MQAFSRGQKGKLADVGLSGTFQIGITLGAAGLTLDVSCFGLDAQGKLSDDRFLVFYNQKASPGDAVVLTMNGVESAFKVDLARLPASIERLVFTATLDGGVSLAQLGASRLRVGDAIEFAFSGVDFQQEKAIIIGELYRREGSWRFGAVGQGFNGGLSALLTHFGGSEVRPAPAAVNTPPPPPVQDKISLAKVTLEKRGDKISLEKHSKGFGRIRVNLNWRRSLKKQGFLDKLRGNTDVDLDLGCLFELADGSKGAVQALGNAWGSFEQPPYIHLQADDRTGTNVEGENIFINGDNFDKVRRILVYAFIYQGVPNWAATDGVVLIETPGQSPVEVLLDRAENMQMCAIAGIENNNGQLAVTKLVEYFGGSGEITPHEQMDRRFGFGMRWATGRK